MKIEDIRENMKGIYYLLTNEDMDTLAEYASKVSDNGIIIDIGTAAGGSAFVMSLASKPSVKVHTIDPISNDDFFFNRERLGFNEKLIFYHMKSEDAADKFKDMDIDLLFVDGVHGYEGVMKDYEKIGTRVKKGGIIIFHDYLLYRNTIGVAVDELINTSKVKPIKLVDSIFKNGKTIGMYVTEKL
jgi:predicted O-methyltransferase YrrM